MSKKRFLTDVLGMTEEDAEKELAQIGEERKVNAVTVDRLFGGME
jgi:Mn-dependent DtxR family transcriptional regulator